MKSIDKYAKTFEEVWAAMDRTDEQIAELTASIKETRKEVGGLSKSYGMHAESYFFESLKRTKQFGGINYNYVGDDIKGTFSMPNGEVVDGQFDIVMHNGDSVVIIEVKSKVKREDVKDLVDRKVEFYKKMYPQYAGKKFHLGIAGFSYDKNAEEEAMKRGVGILKLVGENVEIQDKHLIVY